MASVGLAEKLAEQLAAVDAWANVAVVARRKASNNSRITKGAPGAPRGLRRRGRSPACASAFFLHSLFHFRSASS